MLQRFTDGCHRLAQVRKHDCTPRGAVSRGAEALRSGVGEWVSELAPYTGGEVQWVLVCVICLHDNAGQGRLQLPRLQPSTISRLA